MNVQLNDKVNFREYPDSPVLSGVVAELGLGFEGEAVRIKMSSGRLQIIYKFQLIDKSSRLVADLNYFGISYTEYINMTFDERCAIQNALVATMPRLPGRTFEIMEKLEQRKQEVEQAFAKRSYHNMFYLPY